MADSKAPPVAIKLADVTIPSRCAFAMASLTLRVSPKSSAATISCLLLSVGALFTASPYRARASRGQPPVGTPPFLRLRAIALALRAAAFLIGQWPVPPRPRPGGVSRSQAQIYFPAKQCGFRYTTGSRLQVRRNLEPG